jgi:hypothetical protein
MGFPPVLPSANTAIMAGLPSYKPVEGGVAQFERQQKLLVFLTYRCPVSMPGAWESQRDIIMTKSRPFVYFQLVNLTQFTLNYKRMVRETFADFEKDSCELLFW